MSDAPVQARDSLTSWRPDSPLVGRCLASPNHGERRGMAGPDCLILHYTGMADGTSAIAWLCNPLSEVSCHYVVEEDGAVLQLVPEARRAWHAGRSSWAGDTDMNSRSIGIEIVNGGHPAGLPDYPDRQIEAVIALCRDIIGRHAIRPARVLAHSDVAPGRKQDPGEKFPWKRLAEAGIGLWATDAAFTPEPVLEPGQEGQAVRAYQDLLARYGYGLEPTGRFDAATETVTRAFQLHFRPDRVDGCADAETVGRLQTLISNAV